MQNNEKLRSPFPQPWVVGITRNDRSPIVCSGVLINELYVLTTANCARMTTGSSRVIIAAPEMSLNRKSTSFASETTILQQLRAGAQSGNNATVDKTKEPAANNLDDEDNSSPFFDSLPIMDVRINPKFVSSLSNVASYSLRNDIALIRLQHKLPLAQRKSRATAICLPDQPFARLHEPYERVHIAGYAAAFSGQSQKLSKTDANESDRFLWQREAALLSSGECKQIWKQFYQKGRQLCTQARQNGLCEGGLGSGLTVRRYGRQYLLGLLSLGSRQCARSSMPDLFVDLAPYLPWIYRNTVDSAYCTDRVE